MSLLLLFVAPSAAEEPEAVTAGGAAIGRMFGDPLDPYSLARLDDDLLLA